MIKITICHSLIDILQNMNYSPEETTACNSALPGKMTPYTLDKWPVRTIKQNRENYTFLWCILKIGFVFAQAPTCQVVQM